MAANFFSSLFGGGQPTAAQGLQAKLKALEAETAKLRSESQALRERFSGGSPVEQAQGVAQITGQRERDSADTTLRLVNDMQPNFDRQNARAIDRNSAARRAEADAESQVIGAQGSNSMNLLKQLQAGETAARNSVFGEGNTLIGSLDQSYLARTGGTKMDFLNKAQEINSQITPRDLLAMVGPLAGLALAFS